MLLHLGNIAGSIHPGMADISVFAPQAIKILLHWLYNLLNHWLTISIIYGHSHIVSSGHMETVVVPKGHNLGSRESGCLFKWLLIFIVQEIGWTCTIVFYQWPLIIESWKLSHSLIHQVLIGSLHGYNPVVHLVLAHPGLVHVQDIGHFLGLFLCMPSNQSQGTIRKVSSIIISFFTCICTTIPRVNVVVLGISLIVREIRLWGSDHIWSGYNQWLL